MNRMASGLCIAAAFSFAASLGAQTTTSSATGTMNHDKDIVVTGCLQRGADGNYMLSNAKMDESDRAGTSTSTGTTGTAGTSTTSGTTASGSATGGSAMGSRGASASTWTLEGSSSDLDKHVGHKIQVTGKEVDSSHSNMGTTGSTTGSTSGSTTGTTGTSGSEASSGRSASSPTGPKLDVSSVKMISSSCS
jgi:hypothetical protein